MTDSIPILVSAVTDPAASGLVESNEVPGGNVSGTSDLTPVKEQIDLMQQIIPDVKKVGLLYCSAEANSVLQIDMAKEALDTAFGTIDALSAWIGSNVPTALIPLAFSFVGAFMSFFSSTTGVVAPALFPLIPGLAAATGLNPAALFACTILGAQSSAISPFSSGGSLILGSCGNEEDRNHLFNRLLFVAVPISVICCAVYNLIVAVVL